MSHQAKWFRQTAHELRLLHFHKLDLSIPRLQGVVETVLPNAVAKAHQQKLDLTHPATWWEIVYTDALLYIENQEGKRLRVAVHVTPSERHAQRVYHTLQMPDYALVREKLIVHRHWVLVVEKDTPHSAAQWVDILYENADRSVAVILGNLVE